MEFAGIISSQAATLYNSVAKQSIVKSLQSAVVKNTAVRELQRKIMRLLKEKIACYGEVRGGQTVMDVIIVTLHYCLHTTLPHTSI